jgi:hypothetical protein
MPPDQQRVLEARIAHRVAELRLLAAWTFCQHLDAESDLVVERPSPAMQHHATRSNNGPWKPRTRPLSR